MAATRRQRILLFGPEALTLGRDAVEVEVPMHATAADVRAALAAIHPALALPHLRLAVNHEFADAARAIGPEDEVAAIGLVSGG